MGKLKIIKRAKGYQKFTYLILENNFSKSSFFLRSPCKNTNIYIYIPQNPFSPSNRKGVLLFINEKKRRKLHRIKFKILRKLRTHQFLNTNASLTQLTWLSMIETLKPSFRSCTTVWVPKHPAPPLTRIVCPTIAFNKTWYKNKIPQKRDKETTWERLKLLERGV